KENCLKRPQRHKKYTKNFSALCAFVVLLEYFMKRFFVIILLCIFYGCGPKTKVGTWSMMDTGKPDDTFFELNFLSPQVGWLTGWDGKGPKETDGWEILQTSDGGKTWTPWP